MVGTSEALQILWVATLAVGVAALTLMVLPRLLRRRFGAGVGYAAWWLLPAAFIASLLPGRVVEIAAVPGVLETVARPVAMVPVEAIVDRSPVWLTVWLIGAMAMALRLWWQQRHFERALGELRPLRDRLWRAQASHGLPAVVGAVHARIVLPADFAERYDSEQRKLMLAHERRHLHRGDPLANLAVAIVRCLFWFNPLVHLAATRFRHDQELACDQAVVAAHPNSRRAYGEAMLKTLMTDRQAPLGCHWGASHPLKERIMQLQSPMPRPWARRIGIASVAILTLGAGFSVWSAQPARVVPSSGDDFSADIQMRIDGGDAETFAVANDFGKSFSFAHQGASGGRIDVDATVRDAGESRYDISMVLKQDGKALAKPRMIVAHGEPAIVKIGEQVRGVEFNGVEIAMTIDGQAPTAERPVFSPPAPPAPPVPPAPPAPVAQLASHAPVAPLPPVPMDHVAPPAPPSAPAPPDTPPPAAPSPPAPRAALLQPIYPQDARAQKIDGRVMLEVLLGKDGRVKDARVVESAPTGVFDQAALDYAMKGRFSPIVENGKPVEAWGRLPFTYSVD